MITMVIKGERYHFGEPGGKIVTVYSIHPHIDNHYYIRFEDDNRVDTTQRERLFPLEERE